MNGVTVDRQVKFIIQLGKTVMDDDKIISEEIVTALRDYGFKDAQVLGLAMVKGDTTDGEVRTDFELPRVDKGEVPDPFNH